MWRPFCFMDSVVAWWTVAQLTSEATQSLHAYTETNMILFISHIIAPRHMIDSEIISNPGNHIWLCNDSLDGDTLQFKNGGHPSDVAEL